MLSNIVSLVTSINIPWDQSVGGVSSHSVFKRFDNLMSELHLFLLPNLYSLYVTKYSLCYLHYKLNLLINDKIT